MKTFKVFMEAFHSTMKAPWHDVHVDSFHNPSKKEMREVSYNNHAMGDKHPYETRAWIHTDGTLHAHHPEYMTHEDSKEHLSKGKDSFPVTIHHNHGSKALIRPSWFSSHKSWDNKSTDEVKSFVEGHKHLNKLFRGGVKMSTDFPRRMTFKWS